MQSTQQVQQVEIPVVEESAHPIDIDTTKRLQFLQSRWSVDEKINKVKHLLTIFELQKVVITTDSAEKVRKLSRLVSEVAFRVVTLEGGKPRKITSSLKTFDEHTGPVLLISTTQLAVNHSVQADLCIIFDLPNDARHVHKLYEHNQKIVVFYDSISDKDKKQNLEKHFFRPSGLQALHFI
ncbi:hypothetical protein GEMRC1_007207 [Eukaryota sp. GEM-RC1]